MDFFRDPTQICVCVWAAAGDRRVMGGRLNCIFKRMCVRARALENDNAGSLILIRWRSSFFFENFARLRNRSN